MGEHQPPVGQSGRVTGVPGRRSPMSWLLLCLAIAAAKASDAGPDHPDLKVGSTGWWCGSKLG